MDHSCFFVCLFLDPDLWVENILFTKNGIDSVDWRCSEAGKKALGMIREVFTKEVNLN